MKKLSIIIPTYNCANYIEKCLDSIINNKADDIEIIIVDDGSNDNTVDIVNQYIKKYNFIKYCYQVNQGPSIAKNNGLLSATGEYFTFIDADDYVEKDYFNNIIPILEKEKPDMLHVNKLNRVIKNKSYIIDDKICEGTIDNILEYSKLLIAPLKNENKFYSVSLCKNIFKRSIIIDNKLEFPQKRIYYAEDRIFLYQFVKFCKKIYVINDSYYNYVYREKSLMNIYDINKLDKIIESFNCLKEIVLTYDDSCDMEDRIYSYYVYKVNEYFKELVLNKASNKFIRNQIVKLKEYNISINKDISDNSFKLIINNKILLFKFIVRRKELKNKIKQFIKLLVGGYHA